MTNASTTVAGLPWSSINGGDIVYVSGGSDSTVYPKDGVTGKVVTSGIITITHGTDAGHNGRVIFAQSGIPTGSKSSFELSACQNIKLYGLTFKTAVTNCIIDHDTIYNNLYGHGYNDGGNGFGIYMNGSSGHPSKKITITNNYIECFTNNTLARADDGRDPIWTGSNYGGHTIMNNSIISHDAYTTNSHPDLIQMTNEGSDSNFVFTVANNFMMMKADSSSNGQCFYSTVTLDNRFEIYNNIIVNSANPSTGITIQYIYGGGGSPHHTARIYNNTIITKGIFLAMYDTDTLMIKNNILINASNSSSQICIGLDSLSFSETPVLQVDYNHYWRWMGTNSHFISARSGGGTYYSAFTDWKASNGGIYDQHSDTGSVSFVNLWGTNAMDYKLTIGSMGIDQGTNLSSIFTNTYDGITRSGTWDMGAFEFP